MMRRKSLFVGLLIAIAAIFAIGCGGVIEFPEYGGTDNGNKLASVDQNTISTSLKDGRLSIEWSAVDGAQSYLVVFGSAQFVCTAPATRADFNNVEYTSGTLTVTIVARGAGYDDSAPTTYTFVPGVNPGPGPNPQPQTLATPSGLTVSGGTLRWNAVTNATSYDVSDGTKTVSVSTNSIALATNGLTVPTSGSITYTVVAKAGGYNNSAAAQYTYTYAPPQPTTLSMPTGLVVGGTTLTWIAVPNATSYTVSDGTTTVTVNTNTVDLAANGFSIPDGSTKTYTVIAKAPNYNDSPAASKTHTFAHEHAFAAQWTSNETHHWHAVSCGHSIIAEESQGWGVHDFGDGNTCSTCSYVREMQELGRYVYYGEYPQSLKDESVSVGNTADADGYYLGDDGARYAKVTAATSTKDSWDPYKFSNEENIVNGNTYYFKVEPIKWRVLENKNGVAFLLCDTIIDHSAYYNNQDTREIGGATVYPSNYEHSDIRTWLNGTFYVKAFSTEQRQNIQITTVDNSAASTGKSENMYACNNTQDMVFLPSYKEVHNSAYGFVSEGGERDELRRFMVSDYARATGTYIMGKMNQPINFGRGMWWTRSPIWDGENGAELSTGSPSGTVAGSKVDSAYLGVIPAMRVTTSALTVI
ncbi:MAG: hypothetical protein K2I75_07395 [Clostridiales bacterium]|nr:hypothetical protein [Clostridiales bacterium]